MDRKKGRCAMDMISVKREANEQPRNILLKVAGKSFRCSCGCNIFQKLDPDNENEYTCNACHATYKARGA